MGSYEFYIKWQKKCWKKNHSCSTQARLSFIVCDLHRKNWATPPPLFHFPLSPNQSFIFYLDLRKLSEMLAKKTIIGLAPIYTGASLRLILDPFLVYVTFWDCYTEVNSRMTIYLDLTNFAYLPCLLACT